MIEVFKTNVNDPPHARLLVTQINRTFADYTANFDLDDCDNILRVKNDKGGIQADLILGLLKDFGFSGEILSDTQPEVLNLLNYRAQIET